MEEGAVVLSSSGKRLSTPQNMIWNALGSLWYLVSQWLISVLAVRLGSLSMGGVYYLAVTTTSFFYVFCTFGIRVFQVSDDKSRFSAGTYLSTRILTSLAGFLAFCLFSMVSSKDGWDWVPILYMGYRLTEAMVDVLAGEQQRAWRMDQCAVSFFLRGSLTLAGFVAAMMITHNLTMAVGVMVIMGLLVILLYDLPAVTRGRKVSLMPSIRQSAPLLREAMPLVLNVSMMALLAVIPRYFLSVYFSEEVVGIYGALATPAVMIQAISGFIYTPLVNPLTSYVSKGDRRGMRRMMIQAIGALTGLLMAALAGAHFLGEWGLSLLYGSEMVQHAGLLSPVLVTAFCIAMIYFFDVPMTVQRRLKVMTVVHAVWCVLSLVLSLWLVPGMGIAGVNLVLMMTAGGDSITLGILAFHG